MNRSFLKHMCLALAVSAGFSAIICSPDAEAAKKYTITERMVTLSQKIEAGQKSGELTLKESDSLRGKMSDVKSRVDKFESKNGGKLSYDNETSIEKDLNKVSERLQKKELAKRVSKPNE